MNKNCRKEDRRIGEEFSSVGSNVDESSTESQVKSEDKRLCLSERISGGNGWIDPKELTVFRETAAALSLVPNLKKTEREWLADFASNVVRAALSDRVLDQQVSARVDTAGIARTSNSRRGSIGSENSFSSHHYSVAVEARSHRAPKIDNTKLVIRPTRFDPKKDNARRWIDDFEDCSKSNAWHTRDMVTYLPTYLNKSARDWFNQLVLPTIDDNISWNELRSIFLRFYVGPDELDAVKEELNKTRQMREETVTEFMPRLLRLVKIIDPKISEREKVREVRNKLRDVYQDKLLGQHPTTLTELNDLCLEIEKRLNVISLRKKEWDNKQHKKNFVNTNSRYKEKNSTGKSREETNKKQSPSEKDSDTKCFRCDNTGHLKANCFALKKKDGTILPPKATVKAVNLQENDVGKQSKPEIITYHNVSAMIATVGQPKGIIHNVRVNDMNVQAFFDTGSWPSLNSMELANELQLKPIPRNTGLLSVDGKALKCMGTAEVNFQIKIGSTM